MATTKKTGEPYKLSGSRLAFLNWYYIRPGTFGWFNEKGEDISVGGSADSNEAHLRKFDQPYGIRIVAHKAGQRGVFLLQPDHTLESAVSINTVIKNGVLFQAWGRCKTPDGQTFPDYFESDDGREWRRPRLGIRKFRGNQDNNFIEDVEGTVFFDPAGLPQERYKSMAEYYFSQEEFKAYCRKRPNDFDPKALRTDIGDNGAICGARGYVSPDGLHWTAIKEPLVVMHTDTQIVCYYDQQRKKYVAYFRDWMIGERCEYKPAENKCPLQPPAWMGGSRTMAHYLSTWMPVGRRSIGRSETDNFRNFSLSEVILEPRPDMKPTQVLYTNCKTTFPQSPDQHLLFPAVWDIASDTTSIELASSHDGKVWNYLPGTPILETAPFGEWDGGCVFTHPNLIELKDGDFALPYTGYNVPHKYPRGQYKYATAYAIWPKGRLVALESSARGEFTTVAIIPPGQKLRINALTKRDGFIRIEALRLDGKPVSGREFANSIPLNGDCYKTPVVWKEHSTLGLKSGEPVILRFKMEKARIYFLDFD